MSSGPLYIASDHRGFPLKQLFIEKAQEKGLVLQDLGPANEERCDGSDFANKLALALRQDPSARGILICGTGQVMAMTANRYQHLRAALCTNATMARLARQHNDANVLCLGAHISGQEVALACFETFIATAFLGGRYGERVDKLTAMGGL